MEFKGSKGKWTIEETKNGHQQLSSLDWGNFCKVCNVTNVNNKYIQIARANALLISKAPILLDEHFKDLEFLEKIAKQLDELGGYLESDVLDRIEFKKQLIKQATEL